MADDTITIATPSLSAGIALHGAELQFLRDDADRDLLWGGDPAIWAGRAPILFPIVGELNGGEYRLDGKAYALARHGFARKRRFTPIAREASAATFRLEADAASRAAYPFDFRLDIRFAITGAALDIVATVGNLGTATMPASFGFHPALRWPLPYGAPRAAHRLLFAEPEPAPIRRLDSAGLLAPDPRPTPIADRTLALDDALFADDAIILDRRASRGLRYGAPDGPQLAVDYPDMPLLGLWTKPGAGYICIEPWQGFADPAGFTGDIFAKPGILAIGPGESRHFAMRIALES